MITKAKAEAYRIVGDVIGKLSLVFASVVVLFVMTGFLIWKPNIYFAVVDMVFGYTVGRVILHYFPATKVKK